MTGWLAGWRGCWPPLATEIQGKKNLARQIKFRRLLINIVMIFGGIAHMVCEPFLTRRDPAAGGASVIQKALQTFPSGSC